MARTPSRLPFYLNDDWISRPNFPAVSFCRIGPLQDFRHFLIGQRSVSPYHDVVTSPALPSRSRTVSRIHAVAAFAFLFALTGLLAPATVGQDPKAGGKGDKKTPSWIWLGEARANQTVYFRKEFVLPKRPRG